MKKTLPLVSLCAAILALVISTNALAENAKKIARLKNGTPRNECADLIRDCYTQAGIEKSNCLYNSSRLPACEKSRVGNLAFRRWSTSPVRPPEVEDMPALLGPSTQADKECLAQFDNEFSSALATGLPSEDRVMKLQSKLESCKRDPAIDLRS